MSKIVMYLRQTLATMREEKLYSAMYICGTALAIAFTMLIAEVYYIKVADIAPEVNRSKTYYLNSLKRGEQQAPSGIYSNTFRDLFQKMQTPECVMATAEWQMWSSAYMKLSDNVHDHGVRVKLTEPGFFRFYQFNFTEGAPFTQDDFDNRSRTVVVTTDVAELIFGKGAKAVGQRIYVNNRDFTICGVVETPSSLTEKCVADIWCPYNAQGLLDNLHFIGKDGEVVKGEYNVDVDLEVAFAVPVDKRDAFLQEMKEVEARYNSMHKDEPVEMVASLETHNSTIWHELGGIFQTWDEDLYWYVTPAILLLLLVPALNLSGMVASRMECRLPEMAIRKAFGAKRRTLFWQVIMENLLLTLMGGAIGLCLAWTALYSWRDWVFSIFSMNNYLYESVPIIKGEMFFGPVIFLIALVICCTLNVMAATLPAWLSLRKPIVEGMMKEEQGEGGGWRSKIWIAAELILVTIACWWAFDPVLVTGTVIRMNPGFDVDRMVKLNVSSTVTRLDIEEQQITTIPDEEEHLLQKVQELEDVVLAYRAVFNPIGLGIYDWSTYFYHDSDSLYAWQYEFLKDSRMFEVYGIQSITPEVPTSELSHDCEGNDVILTRSMAMGLFGTIDVAGRSLISKVWGYLENGEYGRKNENYRIRAVVEDVRHHAWDRDLATVFKCSTGSSSSVPIIVRLREGVNAERFLESHKQQLQTEMTTEHCYIRDFQTARDAFQEDIDRIGVGGQMRRNLFIAAFFSVNLAFGVFGTLLMYTRERREEAGIRRAFGATKWSVFLGFLREAWLLTTVSVIIGCIIYFQFAAAHGLNEFLGHNPNIHYWFDSFGTHFLVVSACVYLIILVTVLIGTAIPAWRISRTRITEAIKEE